MKKELRKIFLEKRRNIINRESKDKIIVSNINSIIEKYQRIMIYYPISSEPNILNIIKREDKKFFYLPFCDKNNIEPRLLTDLNNLIKDEVNILSSNIKTSDNMEVVIAPAVACNDDFYRLGYGGGYYDRFLQNKDVIKITVLYDDLLTNIKYQETFDVKFDYIVTEKRILKR